MPIEKRKNQKRKSVKNKTSENDTYKEMTGMDKITYAEFTLERQSDNFKNWLGEDLYNKIDNILKSSSTKEAKKRKLADAVIKLNNLFSDKKYVKDYLDRHQYLKTHFLEKLLTNPENFTQIIDKLSTSLKEEIKEKERIEKEKTERESKKGEDFYKTEKLLTEESIQNLKKFLEEQTQEQTKTQEERKESGGYEQKNKWEEITKKISEEQLEEIIKTISEEQKEKLEEESEKDQKVVGVISGVEVEDFIRYTSWRLTIDNTKKRLAENYQKLINENLISEDEYKEIYKILDCISDYRKLPDLNMQRITSDYLQKVDRLASQVSELLRAKEDSEKQQAKQKLIESLNSLKTTTEYNQKKEKDIEKEKPKEETKKSEQKESLKDIKPENVNENVKKEDLKQSSELSSAGHKETESQTEKKQKEKQPELQKKEIEELIESLHKQSSTVREIYDKLPRSLKKSLTRDKIVEIERQIIESVKEGKMKKENIQSFFETNLRGKLGEQLSSKEKSKLEEFCKVYAELISQKIEYFESYKPEVQEQELYNWLRRENIYLIKEFNEIFEKRSKLKKIIDKYDKLPIVAKLALSGLMYGLGIVSGSALTGGVGFKDVVMAISKTGKRGLIGGGFITFDKILDLTLKDERKKNKVKQAIKFISYGVMAGFTVASFALGNFITPMVMGTYLLANFGIEARKKILEKSAEKKISETSLDKTYNFLLNISENNDQELEEIIKKLKKIDNANRLRKGLSLIFPAIMGLAVGAETEMKAATRSEETKSESETKVGTSESSKTTTEGKAETTQTTQEFIATKETLVQVKEVLAGKGDNLWKLIEKNLEQNMGEKFNQLSPEQKTYVIDYLKDYVLKHHKEFGLSDKDIKTVTFDVEGNKIAYEIANIKIGYGKELTSLFLDKQNVVQEAFQKALGLKAEDIKSISESNKLHEAIAKMLKETKLTQEKEIPSKETIGTQEGTTSQGEEIKTTETEKEEEFYAYKTQPDLYESTVEVPDPYAIKINSIGVSTEKGATSIFLNAKFYDPESKSWVTVTDPVVTIKELQFLIPDKLSLLASDVLGNKISLMQAMEISSDMKNQIKELYNLTMKHHDLYEDSFRQFYGQGPYIDPTVNFGQNVEILYKYVDSFNATLENVYDSLLYKLGFIDESGDNILKITVKTESLETQSLGNVFTGKDALKVIELIENKKLEGVTDIINNKGELPQSLQGVDDKNFVDVVTKLKGILPNIKDKLQKLSDDDLSQSIEKILKDRSQIFM